MSGSEHRGRVAWGVLAWAAGLLAVGGVMLSTAWGSPLAAGAVVAAGMVPLVLVTLTVARGVSAWAVVAVAMMLLLGVGYLLTAEAGTPFARTLVDAVPRLLTEPRPVPVRADLLAAPVMLAGIVATAVAVRLGRRARVAPVVGGAVLYLAGTLLTAGTGDRWGLLAGVLLATAVVGWVLLDEHPEALRRRLRVVLPAAAVGVAVLGFAATAPAAAPFAEPFDPREVVEPPVTDVRAGNPLAQLAAWSADPAAELLRVDGPATPLRLATLSSYDGTAWRASTRYARLGSLDEAGLPPAAERRTVTTRVTVGDLAGDWLPTPGTPRAVDGARALVDTTGSTLLRPSGAAGAAYAVTAEVDTPDPATLPTGVVPLGADGEPAAPLRPYLDVPALPGPLQDLARDATARWTTPYDRAIALETAIRGGRELSPEASSGSALWRLERFLLDPREAGGQVGSSEQFATAYAVLARSVGLPTRVVVGFRPGTPEPGADPDDGVRVVRGADALAWPEVWMADLGWVAFSPLPDDATPGTEGDAGGGEGTGSGPGADQAPEEDTDPGPTSTEPDADDADETTPVPDPADGPGALRTTAIAAPLGLLGLLALSGLLRAGRSWRHRRSGPTGRWREVVDALRLSGAAPRREESAGDLARRTDDAWGTAGAAGRLSAAAERTAFAPPDGTDDTGADPVTDLRAVRRAARRAVPAWRRWWWPLDPRVLLR